MTPLPRSDGWGCSHKILSCYYIDVIMKAIIILLSFIGIVSIVIGYINQIKTCPPAKVEYRYIPRTFEDEQNDPVKVTQLFKNMFDAWTRGTGRKESDILARIFITLIVSISHSNDPDQISQKLIILFNTQFNRQI